MTSTQGSARNQIDDPTTWFASLDQGEPGQAETSAAAHNGVVAGWRTWLGEPPPPVVVDLDLDSDPSNSATALVLDDDVMAPLAASTRARAQKLRRQRLMRRAGLVAGAATGLTVVVVGVLVLANRAADTSTAGVTPTKSVNVDGAGATPAAPAWCAPLSTPKLVVGNGPGDLTTATGVILWQQAAIYDSRDVDAVRSVLTPDAVVADAASTRAFLDAIPAKTEHCVTISPTDTPDRWDVQISERRPDKSEPSWAEVITTVKQADGKYLIKSITNGGA